MDSSHSKKVFISYRRRVSAYVARAIFQDLTSHDYDVFMDVESIDSGTFASIILHQIAARPHFLIILTAGSVEGLSSTDDWLRREIEYAMELGRNVVPILIHGFSFADHKQYFTGKLKLLSHYNALRVPHDYFESAMDKLRNRFLKQPMTGAIHPIPEDQLDVVLHKMDKLAHQPMPTQEQLTSEGYYEQGVISFRAGNHDHALTCFDEAIRHNPELAAAFNNRGCARKALGDLDGAIADFDDAIRLDPRFVPALNNRGNAVRAGGDLETALADYNQAIEIRPEYTKAYMNRGATYYRLGDPDRAIADYQTYLDLGGSRRAEVQAFLAGLEDQSETPNEGKDPSAL